MSNRVRAVLPVAVSLAVGATTAGLMFALPGEAATLPAAYSASATGDVWHVNQLDLDMSGDPVAEDLSVAHVGGLVGASSPNRAQGRADNLAGNPTPSGQTSVVSSATASQDTAGTTSKAGAAGTVPSTLTYQASTLTARGHWTGDTSCVSATDPLTSSRSISNGSGVVPATIPTGTAPAFPIPLPTTLPTEFPTGTPTDFPTGIPTEIPTVLPTDPTTLTTLITLPTASITLPIRPASPTSAGRAGEVPMASVAGASVEEKTFLKLVNAAEDIRAVSAEATGSVTTPAQPVATFFGGEVSLTMTGQPKLTAYADGTPGGSKVTWTPPTMALVVGGDTYPVPTDGTALAVPYSQNADVVLTVAAGHLSAVEDGRGYQATGQVTTLDVLIKHGDTVALDADLFPLRVEAKAPEGGVECALPDADGDGLSDALEAKIGTDPDKRDTDGDHLSDGREYLRLKTNPLRKDTDRDHLGDGLEVKKYKTNPRRADTDSDKLKDGAEVKRFHTNPRKKDTDGDHLGDGVEVKKYKTNPRKKDTDGDGVNDNIEIRRGTDPLHK